MKGKGIFLRGVFLLGLFVVCALLCILFFTWCPKGTIARCNYKTITIDMSLAEVEAILGPGEEITKKQLPRHPSGPVVTGEKFFQWAPNYPLGKYIIIALRDDKVCDKFYWEPSL